MATAIHEPEIDARRAPLFFVALFYATGCWLGFHWPCALGLPLACFGSAILGWVIFPAPRLCTVFFYGAVFSAGLFQARVDATWLDAHDVRQLAPETLATPALWRGRVVDAPEFHARTTNNDGRIDFTFALESCDFGERAQSVTGRVQVRLARVPVEFIRCGQQLEISGPLQPFPVPHNPGQFDARAYFGQRHIFFQLKTSGDAVRILAEPARTNLIALAVRARDWARARLTLGLENDPLASRLLAGMLFGYRSDIPADIEADFRTTGTYHIFAVSGQNVAELLFVGLLFFQLGGLMPWRWGWLLAPFLIFYALLSGVQASVIRAVVMASLILFVWRLGRPAHARQLWALALLMMIGTEPRAVLDLGLQLSFAVVLALLLVSPPLTKFFHRPFRLDSFIPRSLATHWRIRQDRGGFYLAALWSASVAAWLGALPLELLYFHQISWVALLANLIVVPLAGLVVIVGTLALVSGLLWPALTLVLNNTNWLVLHLLLSSVKHFAAWPAASFYTPPLAEWRDPSEPEFIWVQASATPIALLRYRRENWLIQTGASDTARYVVNPMRKFYGVNFWDQIVLTQLTTESSRGAFFVQKETPVRRWILPPGQARNPSLQAALSFLAQPEVKKNVWQRDAVFSWDKDFSVTVLSPDSDRLPTRAEDAGLVLLFNYRGQRLLYAGQISFGVEQQILARFPDLRAEVLVQGRHTQEPSLSVPWLMQLRPRHLIRPAPSAFQRRVFPDELLPVSGENSLHLWSQETCGAVRVRLRKDAVEVTAPWSQ